MTRAGNTLLNKVEIIPKNDPAEPINLDAGRGTKKDKQEALSRPKFRSPSFVPIVRRRRRQRENAKEMLLRKFRARPRE